MTIVATHTSLQGRARSMAVRRSCTGETHSGHDSRPGWVKRVSDRWHYTHSLATFLLRPEKVTIDLLFKLSLDLQTSE